MDKKILLVGGGGHCKAVLDSLLKLNEYLEIGIIDKKENIGNKVLGIPVIGCDEDLLRLFTDGYRYAFVTLGSVGDPNLRRKLFNQIEEIGFLIPNVIDSSATVSEHANMETGIFIGKNAVVNVDCTINSGAIINTGAIVEHDCVIESFVHIAPGTVISGKVYIGKNTHIGANSVIKQQVKVGANTVIGMGSVVVEDIQDNVIAYGNPCREVRLQ